MNDLHYGSFACTNEIKPKFPPKVQRKYHELHPMEQMQLVQAVNVIL